MTDLVITAANVKCYGTKAEGIAGATIVAGNTVRRDASTGKMVLSSDNSAVNAETAGVALNAASDGQPLDYQKSGLIDLGATIAVGKVYVQSTDGGIAPVDDHAGGEFATVIGVGTAANRLKMGIIASGVAAAGAVA